MGEVKSTETELTPESRLGISPGFRMIEIDNELVLADMLGDRYFRINATGAFIWRLLFQQPSLEEISNKLSRESNISHEEAVVVARQFLKILMDRGLAAPTS